MKKKSTDAPNLPNRQKCELLPFKPDIFTPEGYLSDFEEMIRNRGITHAALEPISASARAGNAERIHALESITHAALEPIFASARAGNVESIHAIVNLTNMAALMVKILETEQRKAVSLIASRQQIWPIVVTLKTDWKSELERLAQLGFGQGDVRFRPALGADENYAARRWAMQAVRYIWNVRFVLNSGFEITNAPPWVTEAQSLPEFSFQQDSRKKWQGVVRAMIREQIPDFDKLAEWKRYQRPSSRARSKKAGSSPTRGEVRNAILDDIVAALKTISQRPPAIPPT